MQTYTQEEHHVKIGAKPRNSWKPEEKPGAEASLKLSEEDNPANNMAQDFQPPNVRH
jgi:hypothetical protein